MNIINRKIIIFLAVSISLLISNNTANISAIAKEPEQQPTNTGTTVFIPLTSNYYPKRITIFGAQINSWVNPNIPKYASESGLFWARIDAFNWAEIEPSKTNPATYDWSKAKERPLKLASQYGMQVIALVQSTPTWAQKEPPYSCGPILQANFPDFAQYLTNLVKRYSVAPYNVKYWELGNEPDIDPSLLDPNKDNVFGCWGDESDSYYGGGYYAEMLKVAYPAIKAADPQAKILIGGLLLDCDPTNPPPGKSCKPGKFLEGILRNGGGEYFDYVSFHGYPYYGGTNGRGELYYDVHYPGWEHRGGIVLGKISFIREVLAKYGYGIDKPEKQIMHTEGSLICTPVIPECNPPTSSFYQAQADYVIWMFVRNWANNVKATMWYQFEGPGWRYGSLLDDTQEPRPAYYSFKFLIQELKSTTYLSPVGEFPLLTGYKFMTNQKEIWVIWSPDEVNRVITLPTKTIKVLDKYGTDITPTNGQLTVKSPVYFEMKR